MRSLETIVVAAPVIVACLEFICVWIALVTPSKYPISVEVTSETATLPEAFDIRALVAVRSLETIVVAAPVIVACLESICVWIALVTPSK